MSETKLDSDTEYEEGAIWLTIVKLPNTWGGGGQSNILWSIHLRVHIDAR